MFKRVTMIRGDNAGKLASNLLKISKTFKLSFDFQSYNI